MTVASLSRWNGEHFAAACPRCGSPVEIDTVEEEDRYGIFETCTNPACGWIEEMD